MNFVQDCLDTCIKNHGSCQLVDPPLPKRVLFFEANTLSDAPFLVHLYIPKRLDRQPYAALSHCWGSREDQMHILKAEKENLTTLESSIPWNRLSKTFQDGITVASKLGLQYIWIDSLCIIQDDKDDWIIEAAKMGEIYQNAYVTIAAASSPSNRVHFLKDRSSFSHPLPVKFYGPQKASVPRRILAQIGIAKPKTGFDSQIAGPLSSRAWTFQERALSTRIVHFSDEGIVYECLQNARRESSISSFPSILSRWEQFKPISSLQEKDAVKMRNKLQIFWREVLINYTARYITFRTDILPALSSTAARMHNLIESPYLAGLWQDRFVEDLCW
ncbi:Heterokaryon incompatibility protein (HET) domain containing protein, partial [Hyaloscypha variabilis]